MLNKDQVLRAVQGSHTVYLMAGLVYKIKIWQTQWPMVMQNVIDACKATGARLVFFDNVYALGLVQGPITEASPIKPSSKKGEVRAQLCRMLLAEQEAGRLQVIIARAPDFYGIDTPNSFLNFMVIDRMKKGQRAQAFLRTDRVHSYIYTEDAGRATAILGTTDSAFNQIWNLPIAKPDLTTQQLAEITGKLSGTPVKFSILPRFMVSVLGLFIFFMKEMVEMLYQYEHDYVFDCSKFAAAFPDFKATLYEAGIQKTLAAAKA